METFSYKNEPENVQIELVFYKKKPQSKDSFLHNIMKKTPKQSVHLMINP